MRKYSRRFTTGRLWPITLWANFVVQQTHLLLPLLGQMLYSTFILMNPLLTMVSTSLTQSWMVRIFSTLLDNLISSYIFSHFKVFLAAEDYLLDQVGLYRHPIIQILTNTILTVNGLFVQHEMSEFVWRLQLYLLKLHATAALTTLR